MMSDILETVLNAVEDLFYLIAATLLFIYPFLGLISVILVIILLRRVNKQQKQIISLATGLQVTLHYLANPENSETNLAIVKQFYHQNFTRHTIKKDEKNVFCPNCGAMNLPKEKNCFECNNDLTLITDEKTIKLQ